MNLQRRAAPGHDPYVYVVQCEAWKEGSLHDDYYAMEEYRESPRFTLVGVYSTVSSANRAARSYALRDKHLPGAGERADEVKFRMGRHGCHIFDLDLLGYTSYVYEIATACVQVKRVLLGGPAMGYAKLDTSTAISSSDSKDNDENDDDDEDNDDDDDSSNDDSTNGKEDIYFLNAHAALSRHPVPKQPQPTSKREQHAITARKSEAERVRREEIRLGQERGEEARDRMLERMILHRQQPAGAQSGGNAARLVTPAKRPLPTPADDDEIQFIKEVKRPRN